MDQATIITIIAISIYNIATILLLKVALGQVNLKEALAEKALSANAAPGQASADTSYSRVAGLVGAIVLATFFWGIGNAVIHGAINKPSSVPEMLSGVGPFIIGGASLFLPYAANQLRETFKNR
jgi:hypothetical protein